ncbi:MAG: relaxase domain-containing protein [Candidatus Micrarchaeota archaeon]
MDVLIRYNDGQRASSPQGVLDYLGFHLEDSKEIGGLGQVHGYLSRDGTVLPIFEEEPWRHVGWNGQCQPSAQLIRNLCQGCDAAGNSLTRSRSLFMAPKEFLITLPVELSAALEDRPEVAYAILLRALKENQAAMQEEAVRVRSGKGRKASPDWAPAKLLALSYIHQENRAGETAFHAHGLIFGPALDGHGQWRVWDNGRHVARLSKAGGARDRVTTAIVQEAARWGYQVTIARGRANGTGPQGADVITPDGRRIRVGDIQHRRRIDILAAQEMRRMCGATPLTPSQLELVRRETGRFPRELKGVRRLDVLEKKLAALGLLDEDGRIVGRSAQNAALAIMGNGMAEAQAFLEGLDSPDTKAAAQSVEALRGKLAEQAPAVAADLGRARLRWVPRFDSVLERVAATPGGLRTDGLDKRMRDDLSKLKRAGFLVGEKSAGRMIYRLSRSGLKRLDGGRKDQAEVAQAVADVSVLARERDDDPGQILGRFESAGIQIDAENGTFIVESVGRTHVDPNLVEELGIECTTRPVPDLDWWKRLWDHRRDLPRILRQAVLEPIEMMRRWGAGFKEIAGWWKHRSALVDESRLLQDRLARMISEIQSLDPGQIGMDRLVPSRQPRSVRMPGGNYRGCTLNEIRVDGLGTTLDRLEHFFWVAEALETGRDPDSIRGFGMGGWRMQAERFIRSSYGLRQDPQCHVEGQDLGGLHLVRDGCLCLCEKAETKLVELVATKRRRDPGYRLPKGLEFLEVKIRMPNPAMEYPGLGSGEAGWQGTGVRRDADGPGGYDRGRGR